MKATLHGEPVELSPIEGCKMVRVVRPGGAPKRIVGTKGCYPPIELLGTKYRRRLIADGDLVDD